ncbi:MAG: alpha/beta hydrolase [Pleurocapsa sp. SU_5_0]|nr:alpha/beta hydrolase [Pleurocapsa sp. SU_5_0]NJO97454.1 alpha/beta hydrolase [Pleurocapsa sp. CRU_1_2]NJR47311.1 alpha/beta hydrolase [Hyellaceae cyanobacterium CSU_1_1]
MRQSIKQKLMVAIGIIAALFPTAALPAERITFNIAPFGQFQVKVKDLEVFIATGSSTAELDYYLHRLPPQQIAKLPQLLSTPLKFKPLAIAKFSNSTVGEITLKNLGKGIRSQTNRNGFYALRGAMIAAAFDDRGLSIINFLHHYPLKTVHLDLEIINRYLEQSAQLAKNRKVIERTWFVDHQPQNQALGDRIKRELNPKIPGRYSWQKRTLTYKNPHRHKTGLFDLYQPKIKRSVPVIAISHGMASSRQTFAYLAKHLASYGFAVAVIEHDDMSLAKFDRFLSGTELFPKASNLIDQPLDISFVLDRLELEPDLDLERVGIVGQSFGGYSALALSGGKLIPEVSAKECQTQSYSDILLDLSSLAKCIFNQLHQSQVQLRDPRVKAVIAINPMAKIFGSAGMSEIDIPTMIIGGSNDRIMPPFTEQIEPFSWLKEKEKYLVLIKPATHFSFLQEGLGILPVPDDVVGPRPIYAYPALKTLSTAFFQVYLAQQTKYQTYLQSNTQLNNNAFELSIIRSLDQTELEQFKQ